MNLNLNSNVAELETSYQKKHSPPYSRSSVSSSLLTTDFSVLEQDKENIQPLKQGRSASSLAQKITLPRSERLEVQIKQRKEFEEKLSTANLSDLDDPIEPYLDYLKWIHENFTAGATTDSGLIQLLERITHDFKDDNYYKDEIRYFKVWLEYINFSDSPKDIFHYLYKKKIGLKLGLFYENYANFLEMQGDFKKAEDLYLSGLEVKARPLNRLRKSYNAFKSRKEKFESTNSKETKQIQVLANPSGSGLVGSARASSVRPISKSSIKIYNDNDNDNGQTQAQENNVLSENPGIWNHLDTVKNSKKENTLQPTSWSGQTLLQQQPKSKRIPLQEKLEVFRDSEMDYPVTKLIEIPGKRTERLDFNLELFIPSEDSKEQPRTQWEVLALMRGCYKSTKTVRISKKRKIDTFDSPQKTPPKMRMSNIIPLIDEGEVTKLTNSPTLTFFSKQASKEVFEMFRQPLHESTTEDPGAESELDGGGLSDFVTETITKPLVKINMANEHQMPQTPKPSKDSTPDEDELMSSPFMEEPLHVTSSSEPIIINPLEPNLQKSLLNRLSPLLSTEPDFNPSDKVSGKLNILKRIIKPNGPSVLGNKQTMLEFGSELYCLTKELGKGGFATVYLSEKPNGQLNAIKVESPANEWEYYIMSQISKRSQNFLSVKSLHKFKDESFLVMPFLKQGTILDLINLTHLQINPLKLDESLIIYLTIQLLRHVLELHSIGMIHGDLKPDNCMLDFSQSANTKKPSFKDFVLIDFGRSIDLTLFPANVKFQTNLSSTDQQDCPQLLNNESWCFEPDYYGMANIIHTLLFGDVIKVSKASDGKIKLVENIRRYWQKELWEEFFNMALNSSVLSKEENGSISRQLTGVLKRFEDWFKLNHVACGTVEKINKINDLLNDISKKKK